MRDLESLAKIFRALANPQRLVIFERLREAALRCRPGKDAAMCVCHIADGFELALSTVSHHLKELREAGLIRCEKRGQWVYCSINPDVEEKVEAFFKETRPRAERRRALAG
jgi:ArsR family transcriptional regulator